MRQRTSLLFILIMVTCLAGGFSGDATAQVEEVEYVASEYKPGFDISFTVGWMWGGNADASGVPTANGLAAGKYRWASNVSYAIRLEKPVTPWSQVQLQYTYQPSQMNFDSGGTVTKVSDMSMNYWQIGSTVGIPSGRVMPFSTFTLGINYWKFSNFTEDFYTIENQSKFALTFGLGAKTFFGENQKVGLRVLFRVLPTWYANLVTDGADTISVSGSSIWQWEVGAGLAIKL